MPGLMQLARRRRVALAAVVAVVTLATLPVVSRLRIDPDVLNLLPQSGPAVRAFRTYLSVFGSFDRVYVVFEAPEGEAIDDYAPAGGPLRGTPAARAGHRPEWTRSCSILARTGAYVFDHVFMLLGPDATAGALARRHRRRHARRAAPGARERLRLPSSAVKELVRQDPFNYLGLLRERLSAANAFARIDPAAEGTCRKTGGPGW